LLGLGGFTALPAVLAARSLGIPVALLEINARSGAATRWLSRFAQRVLHAWPSTLPTQAAIDAARSAPGDVARAAPKDRLVRSGIHRWIGPPLAPALCRGDASPESEARARAELGFDPERPLIVVLGGSQGAGALNAFMRAHAPALVAGGIQVLHQTGPNKHGEGCATFTGYRAVEYVDPIEPALRAATVVLCRGGASTLAEVAAMRRPAVVVPYPHHADLHQEHNARELGSGVRIVPEARLGVSARNELASLCSASAAPERALMREALKSAVPSDAAMLLYAELCALADEHPRRPERAPSRARAHA
jgi:UDP-N-acetylglucosamine--N-acetylmuramyl-(pentapeptide) pyrophosphoryl-undecaprenol N-acetylglucosamine transferase